MGNGDGNIDVHRAIVRRDYDGDGRFRLSANKTPGLAKYFRRRIMTTESGCKPLSLEPCRPGRAIALPGERPPAGRSPPSASRRSVPRPEPHALRHRLLQHQHLADGFGGDETDQAAGRIDHRDRRRRSLLQDAEMPRRGGLRQFTAGTSLAIASATRASGPSCLSARMWSLRPSTPTSLPAA
jgi:hypothetical protein